MRIQRLGKTLEKVAEFCDKRKVGDSGPLGFRRSTDMGVLVNSLGRLLSERILIPGMTRFLDLGCADGRVNLFFSYLTEISVGIEIDEWTLDEYGPLRAELTSHLTKNELQPPPGNISLFHGDSENEEVYQEIRRSTDLAFSDFDIYYTYLVMQEEFAGMIADGARNGAVFMVYGLSKIMPRFKGLKLLKHISPLEGIIAVYQKV